jgi:hypothetical protein
VVVSSVIELVSVCVVVFSDIELVQVYVAIKVLIVEF